MTLGFSKTIFYAVIAVESWSYHSPMSSGEVKNVWNYTSTPSVCLYGLDWNKIKFFLAFD